MGVLLVEIIKNISVIAVAVYIITQCKPFRRAINQSDYSNKDKCILVFVFGILSAVGNYLNVPFSQDAMAHTRLIGTIIGGLFGGPIVGLGAGFIGMVPRLFIPVSSLDVILAAMAANVVIGGLAGYISRMVEARRITLPIAFIVAIVSEFILKTAVFWRAALDGIFQLECMLALPSASSTCLGVLLSVYIIHGVYKDEDNIKAQAARKVVEIILKTRGVFRYKGFTKESAQQIAKTMFSVLTVDYVAITTPDGVWAEYAQYNKKDRKNMISLPLIVGGNTVATILLSRPGLRHFLPYEIKWLRGLADFLSLELYQVELDKKTILLSQAELNVLKSQIRPHFLFNMLSNIKAIVGINPEDAKDLICDLSSFLRGRLRTSEEVVLLADELEAVDTYIRLEKARYGERLNVVERIEPAALHQKVPYFIIQILVENAIKHGIFKRKRGGVIEIIAEKKENMLHLTVQDDGVGMNEQMIQRLNQLDSNPDLYGLTESTGIGLKNIHDRLYNLYGKKGTFCVKSQEGKGTTIEICIPWQSCRKQ